MKTRLNSFDYSVILSISVIAIIVNTLVTILSTKYSNYLIYLTAIQSLPVTLYMISMYITKKKNSTVLTALISSIVTYLVLIFIFRDTSNMIAPGLEKIPTHLIVIFMIITAVISGLFIGYLLEAYTIVSKKYEKIDMYKSFGVYAIITGIFSVISIITLYYNPSIRKEPLTVSIIGFVLRYLLQAIYIYILIVIVDILVEKGILKNNQVTSEKELND